MSDINVFSLGGQDENGRNCTIIEVDNDIYIVNAGIKTPINNFYGIDSLIPDFRYLEKRADRIKGVFITHAHDEVFAALPWLIMKIKGLTIYGSDFTIAVAKSRVEKYNINHKNYSFKVIYDNVEFNKVIVEAFSVANSIPGSYAYNFLTPDGSIIFASNLTIGDLGVFGHTDLQKMKRMAPNLLALILDGRRANFKEKSLIKIDIKNLIEEKFRNTSQNSRIIIGAYDEEMLTLYYVIELAIKYKRPVAIYGKVFDFLYKKLIIDNPKLKLPKLVSYKKVNQIKNVVVLVTSIWSRLYKRFLRIANEKDIYLKLKSSDAVIMLALPVNGLEVEATEALDEVTKITPNILDVSETDYYFTRVTFPDIIEIVKTLRPKYFLPISALYRYLVVASQAASIGGMQRDKNIILQNGKVAYFKKGKLASRNGKIKHCDEIIIDGFGIGDISTTVLKERMTLSSEGLVIISAIINERKQKLFGDFKVQLIGVLTNDEEKEVVQKINKVLKEKIAGEKDWKIKTLQNSIRKWTKKIIFKTVRKEPLIIVSFFQLQ